MAHTLPRQCCVPSAHPPQPPRRPVVPQGPAEVLSSSRIPPARTLSSHRAECGCCARAQPSLIGFFAPVGHFLGLPLSVHTDQGVSSAGGANKRNLGTQGAVVGRGAPGRSRAHAWCALSGVGQRGGRRGECSCAPGSTVLHAQGSLCQSLPDAASLSHTQAHVHTLHT